MNRGVLSGRASAREGRVVKGQDGSWDGSGLMVRVGLYMWSVFWLG